ncbi:hypothetical protein [Streptomyces sp. NPDC005805]|uniref:hypothetical protein n=1 Tax=Streptomyces sp. NPDC005805 TaxID=3157068 RepID=UPI003401302C
MGVLALVAAVVLPPGRPTVIASVVVVAVAVVLRTALGARRSMAELAAVKCLPPSPDPVVIRIERHRSLSRYGGWEVSYVLFCWAPGENPWARPRLAAQVDEAIALRVGREQPHTALVRGALDVNRWAVFELQGRTVQPSSKMMKSGILTMGRWRWP